MADEFPWASQQSLLPYWVKAALATRCAGRILPLFRDRELHPHATAESYQALTRAIEHAERCATQGREIAGVGDLLKEVQAILSRLDSEQFETARVSDVVEAVGYMLGAVHDPARRSRGGEYITAGLWGCVIRADRASPDSIRGDLKRDLRKAVSIYGSGDWNRPKELGAPPENTHTGCDPSVFGPLWVNPPAWFPPDAPAKQTQPSTPRERFGLAPLLISAQKGGVADNGVRTEETGLERRIRERLGPFDYGLWRERMAAVELCVCRVELDGDPAGTGFLVGPDVMLTNYHVLQRVLDGTTPATAVGCRFDYKALSTGAWHEGTPLGLHPTDWRLDASPYSPAEQTNTPDTPPPTPDELDYALVRLARSVGGEPVTIKGNVVAPQRGWLVAPAAPPSFTPGMAIMIAQHPHGKPLKLAVDTESVIRVNGDSTRVRYATNTEAGSSGSPVFDLSWNLVALHQLGDPAYDTPAAYNQGVPIDRILARLCRNPVAAAALGR